MDDYDCGPDDPDELPDDPPEWLEAYLNLGFRVKRVDAEDI